VDKDIVVIAKSELEKLLRLKNNRSDTISFEIRRDPERARPDDEPLRFTAPVKRLDSGDFELTEPTRQR
jgi:hypothetical protein